MHTEAAFNTAHFAFHLGTGAYWRDSWNVIDGIIVLSGWAGVVGSASGLDALMAMRAIRCLRPLRAISRFPSVQVAVLCLIESVPLMARVARPALFLVNTGPSLVNN